MYETKKNCKELNKDTNTIINRESKEIIKHGSGNNEMKTKIKMNKTAVTFRLHSLLKDHKGNYPLRLTVSICLGPTYSIEEGFSSSQGNIIPYKICSQLNYKIYEENKGYRPE